MRSIGNLLISLASLGKLKNSNVGALPKMKYNCTELF